MEILGRCFDYEKSVVNNALYDTIDVVGLFLDSANSVRGTLIVSDANRSGSMNRTRADVLSQDPDSSIFKARSAVIPDELSGTIRRALCSDKRKECCGK